MIGSYVPGRSLLHRAPVAAKLVGLLVASLAVGRLDDWRALAGLCGVVLVIYAALGRAMWDRLADLRPLWPMLLVVAILQAAVAGFGVAAASVLRILVMVALASLVTYTTTTGAMLETLSHVFRPLRRFGINPAAPALAIALVIRLVPMLLEAWGERQEAWRARTGRRATFRLVAPFLAESLAMADHMAEALEARGFHPFLSPKGSPR